MVYWWVTCGITQILNNYHLFGDKTTYALESLIPPPSSLATWEHVCCEKMWSAKRWRACRHPDRSGERRAARHHPEDLEAHELEAHRPDRAAAFVQRQRGHCRQVLRHVPHSGLLPVRWGAARRGDTRLTRNSLTTKTHTHKSRLRSFTVNTN